MSYCTSVRFYCNALILQIDCSKMEKRTGVQVFEAEIKYLERRRNKCNWKTRSGEPEQDLISFDWPLCTSQAFTSSYKHHRLWVLYYSVPRGFLYINGLVSFTRCNSPSCKSLCDSPFRRACPGSRLVIVLNSTRLWASTSAAIYWICCVIIGLLCTHPSTLLQSMWCGFVIHSVTHHVM